MPYEESQSSGGESEPENGGSQDSSDPEEADDHVKREEGHLPAAHPHWTSAIPTHAGTSARNRTAASSSTASAAPERPSTVGDGNMIWKVTMEDVIPLLQPVGSMTKTKNMQSMLHFPVLREAAMRSYWSTESNQLVPREFKSGRAGNIEAALITMTGDMPTEECRRCASGSGPFVACINKPGLFKNACGNCHYSASGTRCSFHLQGKVKTRGSRSEGRQSKRMRMTTAANGDHSGSVGVSEQPEDDVIRYHAEVDPRAAPHLPVRSDLGRGGAVPIAGPPVHDFQDDFSPEPAAVGWPFAMLAGTDVRARRAFVRVLRELATQIEQQCDREEANAERNMPRFSL